eukprot:2481930-Prymnesium_polylepis.2
MCGITLVNPTQAASPGGTIWAWRGLQTRTWRAQLRSRMRDSSARTRRRGGAATRAVAAAARCCVAAG